MKVYTLSVYDLDSREREVISFHPSLLEDDQLESCVRELRRRRVEAAKERGISVIDVNYQGAIDPSVRIQTPCGLLRLWQTADDGHSVELDGVALEPEDEIGFHNSVTELMGSVDDDDPPPLEWRALKFFIDNESLLRETRVRSVQDV